MTASTAAHSGRLTEASDRFEARALATPQEVAAGLDRIGLFWGFYTTPSEARLLRAPAERWEEIAGRTHLQELRVFGPDRDLHWLGGQGVALSVSPGGAPPGLAGEPGWWQRDRRSRLWGEHLQGTESWYEERIPDPLRYEGLAAGPEHRYAFLVYREYVHAGAVRYVRYLDVVGGAK